MKTAGIIHFDSLDIVDKQWFDKNQFIYFDKIYYHIFAKKAYANFAKSIGSDYLENYNSKLRELELLQKLGLYEDISDQYVLKGKIDLTENEKLLFDKFTYTSSIVFHEIKDYLTEKKDINWIERYNKLDRLCQEMLSQANSIIMERYTKNSCVPIIRYSNSFIQKFFPELKKDYLSVAFHSIPTISNETSWEQIAEFKSDPDSIKKFLAFKNWINDVSSPSMSEIHLLEKIEHHLNEYRAHLLLHKMKTATTSFELFVTTTAEILENIATLKFSNAAKSIFEIGKHELAIWEAEQNAPFKEVAYIDKATRHFNL